MSVNIIGLAYNWNTTPPAAVCRWLTPYHTQDGLALTSTKQQKSGMMDSAKGVKMTAGRALILSLIHI